MRQFAGWSRRVLAAMAAFAAPAIAPAATPAPSTATAPAPAEPTSQAARDWLAFTDELGKAGLRIHQIADGIRSPEQQSEINQSLMWALSSAVLAYSRLDPDHPDWVPILNSGMLGVNGNMDNVYMLTRLRGTGTYRIAGNRGKLKNAFLGLSDGMLGFSKTASNLGQYDLNAMKAEPDGRFELLLSPVRPPGYTGNWAALDPAAKDTFMFMRYVSYDWKNERDPELSIVRLDQPIAMPRRTAAETTERLASIPRYVESFLGDMLQVQERQGFMQGGQNTLRDGTKEFGKVNSVNVAQQAYHMGEVRLTGSQALILAAEIPKTCEYWSVMLMDSAMNPLDFMFRKSGLNGHDARVDPDGKVRIVISEQDPGVGNWIDKSSYEVNGIRGRFYKCGSPTWSSQVVPIGEVRSALYPGTPTVTPTARQQELRERVAEVQRRRRW